MTELEKSAVEAANAAIGTATEHIKNQRKVLQATRFKLCCITVFACILVVCASVVACFAIYSQQQTIIEQQYALNMQYASLTDLLSGATVTTTHEASADGDGSIAVAGNGNTTAGGDVVNGE